MRLIEILSDRFDAGGVARFLLAGLIFGWSCAFCRADERLPRSVLVVDQFELASSGSVALLSGFRSTLKDSPPPPISLYVENLDLGRFGGGRFNDAVQAYFREKYHDKPIGVIVAVGSAALRLVLGLRNAQWAEVPVIFAAVEEGMTDRLVLPPQGDRI